MIKAKRTALFFMREKFEETNDALLSSVDITIEVVRHLPTSLAVYKRQIVFNFDTIDSFLSNTTIFDIIGCRSYTDNCR